MGKTKWAVLVFFGFSLVTVSEVFLWEEIEEFFDFDAFEESTDLEGLVLFMVIEVLRHWWPLMVLTTYLMYRWTTEYNLENFGYKSRAEWLRAGSPKRKTTDKIKDSMKNIGKKTTDKIPSEKIKDASSSVVERIDMTADRILGLSDKAMKDLDRYHELMKRGIITESDFERKKTQLLGFEHKKEDE